MINDEQLARKSLQYRRDILRCIHHAGAGHTGGSLSCVDILNVLYNRVMRVSAATFASPTRDRYVQSKGQSVEALYVVLADCGFFERARLESLCRFQSHLVGHPTRKVPGVEQNTGALGHGLSICTGIAIGAKLDGADFRTYTLIGDGELAEGSNWEAAMAAAHYKLDNLTAIVDFNTLQITGRTQDVMSSDPLVEKLTAFGWAVRVVDGHDVAELTDALSAPLKTGQPSAVVARTTKGKGVSFMQDAIEWHHKVPDDRELALAFAEIDEALEEFSGVPA